MATADERLERLLVRPLTVSWETGKGEPAGRAQTSTGAWPRW